MTKTLIFSGRAVQAGLMVSQGLTVRAVTSTTPETIHLARAVVAVVAAPVAKMAALAARVVPMSLVELAAHHLTSTGTMAPRRPVKMVAVAVAAVMAAQTG
jgi:hypothetical protein